MLHVGHLVPFVVENIKLFAVGDHGILVIATAHDVDKTVLEVVVGSETCTALADWWKFLNLIGPQVELEDISDRSCHSLIYVISRNDNNLIIRYIDGAAVLKLFVELVVSLVF